MKKSAKAELGVPVFSKVRAPNGKGSTRDNRVHTPVVKYGWVAATLFPHVVAS